MHVYPHTCTLHACVSATHVSHMHVHPHTCTLHARTPRHVHLTCVYTHAHAPTCMCTHTHAKHSLTYRERKIEKASPRPEQCSPSCCLPWLSLVNPFDLLATKEEPPQERPPVNQTLTEVITEQANLSVSAAHSSKVLYVITTSPSHPPQTVPGSHSWAPSVGASSHRVEGSSLNPYRNKGACRCFSFRHRLGYWFCKL